MRLLPIISDEVLRDQIAALCRRDGEIELVELDEKARTSSPRAGEFADVVVLSIRVTGDRLLTRSARRSAQLSCVLFSAVPGPSGTLEGEVQSGLDGYLLRRIEPESLIEAIKLIHRGRSVLDPELARKALLSLPKSIQTHAAAPPQLSKREIEVIELVACGMSNSEIAKHLFISVRTVKSHITHIMAKLGTRNRVGSVMAALRYGLLSRDP